MQELPKRKNFTDLTGKRFGKLLVAEFAGFRFNGNGLTRNAYWKCLCDCGKTTFVKGLTLRDGRSKSCGCGMGCFAPVNLTHGLTYHPLYATWSNMKNDAMTDTTHNIKITVDEALKSALSG